MMHEFNEIFCFRKRGTDINKKNHNFSKLPLLFKKQKYTFQLFSFKYKKKERRFSSKYLNNFLKEFVRFSQNYNDRNVLFSRCFLREKEKKKMSKKKRAFRRLNETTGETMVDKLILT